MILSTQIYDIYQSLKGTFKNIAIKYKVPNASDFVDEWQAQAFFIGNRFDKGELTKKSFDSNLKELSDQPTDVDFLKNFRGYLIKSFENDCLKLIKSNKRTKSLDGYSSLGKEEGASSQTPGIQSIFDDKLVVDFHSSNSKNKREIINAQISDFLRIIKKDIQRSEDDESIQTTVNNIFYKCFYASAAELKKEIGEEFTIIYDISGSDPVVSSEFQEDCCRKIKKYLLLAIIKEECPLTIEKLSRIIFSDRDETIQKRVRRYCFEHHGGLANRFKVILK